MQLIDKPTAEISNVFPRTEKPRLDWIDNLRTMMIFLVVCMHACVTYSHVGSWYFNSPPEPTIPQKIPFFIWQAHLQSFFMGILFFIAGYYADRSLSHRGRAKFLTERVRRLGIPTLLYMLAVEPFIVIVLHPGYPSEPVGDYYRDALSHGGFLGHSGPMWFALALLIFSAFFALIGPSLPKPARREFRLKPVFILGLGLFIGFLTFLVRTVQPQGSSILNMQFCYFSQYVVVFGLGIVFSRQDWLNALAMNPLCKKVGWAALILGPIAWVGVVLASLPIPAHGHIPIDGGWNAFALLYALWEQITGIGLGIGVMAFCAHKLNRRTKLSAWLSDRSFAVYFLHPPVLIALCLWVQPLRSNSYVMALVMTVFALIASFAVADVAKRVPLLKQVL